MNPNPNPNPNPHPSPNPSPNPDPNPNPNPKQVPSFIVAFEGYSKAERAKITKAYQFIHHKTSHSGLPVYIDRIGQLDLAGLKAAYGSQERFLQFLVCYGECTMQYRFPACSLAAGKHIGKGVYIVDLSGFAISNFNSEMRAFLKVRALLTMATMLTAGCAPSQGI